MTCSVGLLQIDWEIPKTECEKMRKRLSLTLALLLAMLTALPGGIGMHSLVPDLAVASCNPGRAPTPLPSGGFAGAWNTGFSGVVGGAYAQIARYSPFLSSYGPGYSADWVMLADTSAPGNYAQMGWLYSSSGPRVFSQVTRPSSPGYETKTGPAPGGSVPYFTVLYNYIPGRFSFQLDGSQWIPSGVSGRV